MARTRGFYAVKPWVIFQSPDPLRAAHGRAGVDAVIIETPFERVRYEAFLYALQGTAVTPALAESLRREAQGHLGFLVYAHSKSEEDRTFLRSFRPATLNADGRTFAAAQSNAFGPSLDFYNVGTFREERWVGSFDFRFAVTGCAASGEVRFADSYGDRYDVRFKRNPLAP